MLFLSAAKTVENYSTSTIKVETCKFISYINGMRGWLSKMRNDAKRKELVQRLAELGVELDPVQAMLCMESKIWYCMREDGDIPMDYDHIKFCKELMALGT